MLVIDAMHCILEGVVHYHCRHVLRLDASATRISADGFKFAFDWPWTLYDPETVSKDLKILEQQVVSVVKVQKALSLAISGDKALTLEQLWTRLDNQGTLGSLQFVAHTLGLPMTLDNLGSKVSMIHVRARCASKKPGLVRAPTGLLDTKSHYIALLVDWRLLQPHSSTAFIIPTGTPETLSYIQQVIRYATTASWLNSVPKNCGEANAGSIKADEWRILSMVYLPIALITLWGDDNGRAPPSDSFLMKALDHTMALFQATIIACKYTMTSSRTEAFQKYYNQWVGGLHTLFPHTHEGTARPNVHAGQHIYNFLLLFGPVISWWCFPFERLIGAIQKINTNDHIGGPMEATIVRTLVQTANLRRWLHRPDCPEAIRQLTLLFDKCFIPVNAPKSSNEFIQRKGTTQAYAKHNGVNFSPYITHKGNANIIYRPTAPVTVIQEA
ncbi:hypothetical protein BT96DRAFT_1001950 [Gymnopus androsaceus JB14]|uniref:Uncharacterized protein n=1 Tax=Gymnopus androsaceus JB14 TaxID=1447944 RepID=A0A6A4GY43_9AGAR|nr:hypothetical protein BT96DRAFT_1001950 [Gymnopus androsaceus JB14]